MFYLRVNMLSSAPLLCLCPDISALASGAYREFSSVALVLDGVTCTLPVTMNDNPSLDWIGSNNVGGTMSIECKEPSKPLNQSWVPEPEVYTCQEDGTWDKDIMNFTVPGCTRMFSLKCLCFVLLNFVG
mgnify:FL=1